MAGKHPYRPKADTTGTVGPININDQMFELDYKWIYAEQEASTIEVRVENQKINPDSLSEWVMDSLFAEIPYNNLLDPDY